MITASAALLLVVAAAGLPATASTRPGPAQSHERDVTALFDQAVKRVRADSDFSEAVMLEADGSPKGKGPVKRASEIVKWRFVLDNQKTEGSPFASVTITYRSGEGFGKVKGEASPFLEDRRINKPPEMKLKEAVSLLKKAGYRDGFSNVTLRRPLGPDKTPPLYIFGVAQGSFVAVNTKTEKVSPLS